MINSSCPRSSGSNHMASLGKVGPAAKSRVRLRTFASRVTRSRGAPRQRNHRPMSVQTGSKRKEGGFAETVRVIIHALIIALVIRTFLFQPFNIPSGSMMDTLLIGDYLFVSKYSYGYSHYSLPL